MELRELRNDVKAVVADGLCNRVALESKVLELGQLAEGSKHCGVELCWGNADAVVAQVQHAECLQLGEVGVAPCDGVMTQVKVNQLAEVGSVRNITHFVLPQ